MNTLGRIALALVKDNLGKTFTKFHCATFLKHTWIGLDGSTLEWISMDAQNN